MSARKGEGVGVGRVERVEVGGGVGLVGVGVIT